MLISRCAWHRRYHGYTKILGISSWDGLHLSFTDGICHKCAARVRADHLRSRFDRGASADRREHTWMPGLVALSLGLAVALVLVARPTHDMPPLPPVTAALPAVEPPAPSALLETQDEPLLEAPAPVVDPPRGSSARPAVARAFRAARRPLGVEPAHRAWLGGAVAPPRLAVRVAWARAPYRMPAPRDVAQSP
jgi:hypothetical protein